MTLAGGAATLFLLVLVAINAYLCQVALQLANCHAASVSVFGCRFPLDSIRSEVTRLITFDQVDQNSIEVSCVVNLIWRNAGSFVAVDGRGRTDWQPLSNVDLRVKRRVLVKEEEKEEADHEDQEV